MQQKVEFLPQSSVAVFRRHFNLVTEMATHLQGVADVCSESDHLTSGGPTACLQSNDV